MFMLWALCLAQPHPPHAPRMKTRDGVYWDGVSVKAICVFFFPFIKKIQPCNCSFALKENYFMYKMHVSLPGR